MQKYRLFFFLLQFPMQSRKRRRLLCRRGKGLCPFHRIRIKDISPFRLPPFPQDALFQQGFNGRIRNAEGFLQLCGSCFSAVCKVLQQQPLPLQTLLLLRLFPCRFQKGMVSVQRIEPFFVFVFTAVQLLLQRKQPLSLCLPQKCQAISAEFCLYLLQGNFPSFPE